MKDQPLEKESWIERFDEKFAPNKIWVVPSEDNVKTIKEIKSFVEETLSEYKNSLLGKIEGKKKGHLWAEFDDDTGEHIIKEYDENSKYGGADVSSGYNSALDDIALLLNEKER